MGWKVVATQVGLHNQIYREVGEVFDLRTYEDGTYPPFIEYLPKKGKDGVVIEDEYTEKVHKTRTLDGKGEEPAHRDFSEDKGAQLIKRGPKKGESMRFGWMRRVPDHVPCGLYGSNDGNLTVDFWSGHQLPQPFTREFFPAEDRRRNHAPIDHQRFLQKEPDEAAA